ncbi:NUDIX family hydrolase [Talaromyces proteolyticus]|uniref:NUDIX family hydrolase n=1 Tax=Talaromyces proteolyticus TaxID=1131652 RepID=A0AAD4L1E9_9EURO|nr:NUDIX family hydrolase [Talaromyces proteolyticus]KAH8702356.1 NUDIX family hydrolase [Talaromyces proteolyticus]
MATTSFTIPTNEQQQRQKQEQLTITCPLDSNLSRDKLLSFPAFNIWLTTLHHSLSRQQQPAHEFHKSPYSLRKIDIQAVDYFGKEQRLGFIKLKAEVSNDEGESLPGSVFLRGGSVGMLLILQPDDVPSGSDKDKRAIMTIQPRIPAGSLEFPEIPAGMLDDSGTFAGGAAKEIYEETGLSIPQNELVDMTSLALASTRQGISHDADINSADNHSNHNSTSSENAEESLQNGVYPSPGGSDEFIPLFLCQKRIPRQEIQAMQGRLTGNRHEREKITLKIVPLENLWKEGLRDGKTLAAWALYKGLKQEGRI